MSKIRLDKEKIVQKGNIMLHNIPQKHVLAFHFSPRLNIYTKMKRLRLIDDKEHCHVEK